jgi:Family of unknown function (DUF5670)
MPGEWRNPALWALVIALMVAWLLGLTAGIAPGFVNLVLLLAVVVGLYALLTDRGVA